MIEDIFKGRRERRLKLWQEVLLIGGGLFVLGLVILALTENPNLFPTVVLAGSFVVPVTFVAFFWTNRQFSRLTLADIGLSFIYGGALSLLLAGIVLPLFVRQLDLPTLFLAAGIEELAKIFVVIALVRWRKHVSEMNGIIIGASVGMGFAALESAGYSFTAFLESGGSLSLTVLLTLFRALLSPAGHGVWTAILAGVLFLESSPFRFRLTPKVLLAFLGVTFLHALWNSLSLLLVGFGLSGLAVLAGQLAIAGLGLLVLAWLWREAKRRQAWAEKRGEQMD